METMTDIQRLMDVGPNWFLVIILVLVAWTTRLKKPRARHPVYPWMRRDPGNLLHEYLVYIVTCCVEVLFRTQKLRLSPTQSPVFPDPSLEKAYVIFVVLAFTLPSLFTIIKIIMQRNPVESFCRSLWKAGGIIANRSCISFCIVDVCWMIGSEPNLVGQVFTWRPIGIIANGVRLCLVILAIAPPLSEAMRSRMPQTPGGHQVHSWRRSDMFAYGLAFSLVIYQYIKYQVYSWWPIDVFFLGLLLILIFRNWKKDPYSRERLKPGDHICSRRPGSVIYHHGIYVSDQKVIHFIRGEGEETGLGSGSDNISTISSQNPWDNSCPRCGDQRRNTGVISSCIDCFLSGGQLHVYEYGVQLARYLLKPRGGTCNPVCADAPDVVLRRSSVLLDNGFGRYHVFINNCEDFAIFCKTGLTLCGNSDLGMSGQAVSLVSIIGSASFVLYLAPMDFMTPVLIYIVYIIDRWWTEAGLSRDVYKVAVDELVN